MTTINWCEVHGFNGWVDEDYCFWKRIEREQGRGQGPGFQDCRMVPMRLVPVQDDLVEIAAVRSLCKTGHARRIREGAHVSIRELGKALGVSHSLVARWEVGDRKPRGDVALRYGDLLRRLLVEGN